MRSSLFVFLISCCYVLHGQGISGSANYGGKQAGRDFNYVSTTINNYDSGIPDRWIIQTGLEMGMELGKSDNEQLRMYGDSLYRICIHTEMHPKDSEAFDKVGRLMVQFARYVVFKDDKSLDVLTFLKEANLNPVNVENGGSCERYSYQSFSFDKGKEFKRYIFPFKNGFARVGIIPKDSTQKPRYGMINSDNEEIIPSIYDTVYDMTEGTVLVRMRSVYTFFDTTGKDLKITNLDMIKVWPFSSGYAAFMYDDYIKVVGKDKLYRGYYYIDKEGYLLLDEKNKKPIKGMVSNDDYYSSFIMHKRIFAENGFYYKLKKIGKYTYASLLPFSGGGRRSSGFNKSGFAYSNTNQIIDTNFNGVKSIPFSNISMMENGFLIEDNTPYFSGGCIPRQSLLDSEGRDITLGKKYYRINSTEYGYWIVTNCSNETSIVNKRGHEIIPFKTQTIKFLSKDLVQLSWYNGSDLIVQHYILNEEDGNSINADCE